MLQQTQVEESEELNETHNGDRHSEIQQEGNQSQGSVTSGYTNLTEQVLDNQLVGLVKTRKDKDQDSIQMPGQTRRRHTT